jgi:hypothetical protein
MSRPTQAAADILGFPAQSQYCLLQLSGALPPRQRSSYPRRQDRERSGSGCPAWMGYHSVDPSPFYQYSSARSFTIVDSHARRRGRGSAAKVPTTVGTRRRAGRSNSASGSARAHEGAAVTQLLPSPRPLPAPLPRSSSGLLKGRAEGRNGQVADAPRWSNGLDAFITARHSGSSLRDGNAPWWHKWRERLQQIRRDTQGQHSELGDLGAEKRSAGCCSWWSLARKVRTSGTQERRHLDGRF